MLNDRGRGHVGLRCSNAEGELLELSARDGEYLVTTMPFKGPAFFLSVMARTTLPDAEPPATT